MANSRTTGIVNAVQKRFEERLLDGSWAPGMRIPAERTLAEEFNVSRATVREAISRLAARDMLVSRQGSGVYVTDRLQAGLASPWRQLVADHPELRWDTLEFRLELECATAHFAAQRATRADLKNIGDVVKRLTKAYKAGDRREEARADADFHEAIAEASHNSMFRFLHAGLIRMLREHIALNLTRMHDQAGITAGHLMEQHLAVWQAIKSRQPEEARAAMRRHIEYTWGSLREQEEPEQAKKNKRPSRKTA
ncbi:MAG TPA: FadR/GntR family transcriptional regulator [Rhodocyclaceae bacterium]|nr:FadR/GntR family transcriptional regulator [Rhodocyclaceae bacterium]